MSGSNWVAAASVLFTSLTAGYATYENNQTNRELEKLKQEHLITLESMKSTQEKDTALQNKVFEVRSQYCNEAKNLYKNLGDAVIAYGDRNLEVKAAAIPAIGRLKIQTIAYLDDTIYDNYQKKTAESPEADNSAIVAALATQLRRCATMKPSNF
ncbi:hypothetical protein JFT85_00855 [Pseudomonas sp. TH04]|uniref:hypothetical protein n=1 Tax=Pseudomonas sp. TH04 TaxID=2796370 RepID=UPI00191125E8|nr:hypothetical protein [Pseudomonas sp. TH04]MBK5543315.1 hypothetical protein [Pseudomonas sp. TH04]